MDIHTFNGKRKIGSTDLNDFTDFQGIGHDPIYKRYYSLKTLIDKVIDPAYADFLAIPSHDEQNGTINWYVPEWDETPVRLSELPPENKAKYEQIKKATVGHYREKLNELSGEDLRVMGGALRYINDDFIYCADNKVYVVAWGMTPDNDRHITMGELVTGTPQKPVEHAAVPPVIPVIPTPVPTPGPQQMATIRFVAGEGASLQGKSMIQKPVGSMLTPEEIPTVVPPKKAKFTGWNYNPLNTIVKGDMTFQAMYNTPKGHPWWWWLLIFLIPLLAILGLLFFLGCFKGCSNRIIGGDMVEVNGVLDLPEITTPDGEILDDNGFVAPITLIDGKLPEDEFVTPPVFGENGELPPIVREEGLPPYIDNRLILFLEDDNADMDAFADAFKSAYPGDEYQIIGYDRYVKSLVIQLPGSKREAFKAEVEQKLPNYSFLVFDESIYEYNGGPYSDSNAPKGWHLDAVKAREGWNITRGSNSVKVAVIDDGIDRSHSMFGSRITGAYNVFTRNNRLSKGVGHGTMVAGLAVGSVENATSGAAGIAPNCSLIPVQVSDNELIPLSALVSGIMYAVHQDADVINVSIAPQLPGLNMFPMEDQIEISQREFLNVAQLWTRVCNVATRKNSIIVFAAGNDDIISSIPPENRGANCIVVGAVDNKLYPTDFTNYGFCTDISAPGEGIYSSYPVNSFETMDGTSFAAPIVTGAIALMRSIDKNITVEQAKNVLYRTGKEVYGFMPPMVQIPEALQAVKNGDFSRGPEREYQPVPGNVTFGDDARRFESWGIPIEEDVPGITIVDGVPIQSPIEGGVLPGGAIIPGTGIDQTTPPVAVNPERGAIPGTDVNRGREIPGVPPVSNTNPQEPAVPTDDYSSIRRRIQQLREELRILEGQLPENQR